MLSAGLAMFRERVVHTNFYGTPLSELGTHCCFCGRPYQASGIGDLCCPHCNTRVPSKPQ